MRILGFIFVGFFGNIHADFLKKKSGGLVRSFGRVLRLIYSRNFVAVVERISGGILGEISDEIIRKFLKDSSKQFFGEILKGTSGEFFGSSYGGFQGTIY